MPTIEGYCSPGGPMCARGIPVPTEPRKRPDSRPARVVLRQYPVASEADVIHLPAVPAAPLPPMPTPPLPADVRAWAHATGRPCGDRGRIKADLTAAYLEEAMA